MVKKRNILTDDEGSQNVFSSKTITKVFFSFTAVMILNHLMIMFLSWSFGECGVPTSLPLLSGNQRDTLDSDNADTLIFLKKKT